MKINRWKVTKPTSRGQMVHISKKEAYLLMQSLTNQLVREHSNSGRWECDASINDKTTEYFSIVIDFKEGE